MVGATSVFFTTGTVTPCRMLGPAAYRIALIERQIRVVAVRTVEVRHREQRRERVEGRVAEPRDAGLCRPSKL